MIKSISIFRSFVSVVVCALLSVLLGACCDASQGDSPDTCGECSYEASDWDPCGPSGEGLCRAGACWMFCAVSGQTCDAAEPQPTKAIDRPDGRPARNLSI